MDSSHVGCIQEIDFFFPVQRVIMMGAEQIVMLKGNENVKGSVWKCIGTTCV